MEWHKIKKTLLNKYFIATVIFVLAIVFFDKYNLIVSHRVKRQVSELHEEETRLREAIVKDSSDAAAIRGNLDALEHYGRENYYMKRPDEDIFVIKH